MVRIARQRGLDEVEELNRARLLLTPERDREIRFQAMTFMVQSVASWRPAEFLRRKFPDGYPCTPKDMYNCILEFLEEQVGEWEKRNK